MRASADAEIITLCRDITRTIITQRVRDKGAQSFVRVHVVKRIARQYYVHRFFTHKLRVTAPIARQKLHIRRRYLPTLLHQLNSRLRIRYRHFAHYVFVVVARRKRSTSTAQHAHRHQPGNPMPSSELTHVNIIAHSHVRQSLARNVRR